MTDLLDLSRRVAEPSAIYTAGGQAHLESARTLGGVAARIRALNPAADRFAVSEQAWPGAYPGLDLFFSWSVYAIAPDGTRDWVASVLVPAPRDKDPATRSALIAALRAHAPNPPPQGEGDREAVEGAIPAPTRAAA